MIRIYAILICAILISCGRDIEDSKKEAIPGSPSANGGGAESVSGVISQSEKIRLLEAINSNDISILDATLKQNSFVDFIFENGESPITYALKYKRTNIVNKLISHTKNIDLINNNNESPLILAIYNARNDVVKLALKKGANLSLAPAGLLPIEVAINMGLPSTTILLLKNGSQLPSSRHISRALESDLFYDVSKLIKDIQGHDVSSEKYLHEAISNGNHHYAEYLINNFDLYKKAVKERNFLITAIQIEDQRVRARTINLLLKSGANPNHPEGVHPLIIATEINDYPVVSMLLNAGSNPLIIDDLGKSPLDYSISSLDIDTVMLINLAIRNLRTQENEELVESIYSHACRTLFDRPLRGYNWNEITISNRISYNLNCDFKHTSSM